MIYDVVLQILNDLIFNNLVLHFVPAYVGLAPQKLCEVEQAGCY